MENNVNSLFRGELQASSSEKRRSKSRTRVWEKVVWFTRRAKGPGKESKNGPDLFNPSPGQDRKSKRDSAPFELKDQCRETNNTTNPECTSIGKAKQKVRKSRSFNYLRRRKLRQFGDDLSTVVAEENADLQNCDTATGTFNDFKSERRISRQDRCNSSNSLLSEIAKGMNGSQQEVKENFRSILSLPLDELTLNDVPSASQSSCTSPSFPRVRRSVSFSGPAYNSWPRKKRVYLGNPSYDLLSPPLKQKRVSGLRKRATFSGFDSSKLNAQNPYLSLCSGTKSTPHLSHGSQIKNQNGSTIGVIHFYKSPASYQSEGTSGKLYEGDKCSRTREEKTAANIHSRLLVSSCPCNCDKEESSTSCSNSLSAELPRTSEDVSDITVSELESEMRNPSSAGIESGCHDNSLSVCKQACDIDNDVDDTTDCLTFNIKSANGSNSAISAFVVEGGECVNSCIIPHPANLLKEDSTEVKTLSICSGKTMTHIDVADDDNALRTSCKKSQDSVESNSSYANKNIAECHNTLGHKAMGIPGFHTGETMTHIDVTDDDILGTSSRKSQDIVESNSSYAKENIAECHYDSTPGHEGMGIPGFYTDLPAPSKHLSNCQNKEHTNEPADCFSIEESQENELVSTETVPADSRLDHNSVEPAHELQASTLPCTLPSVYEMCKSDVVCASQSTHEKGESQLHSQKGKMFWPRKPKINGPQFKQHMEVILQWFGEFNDEQKNIMMRRLLEECELPQMHMLSVAMEPILHKNCPPNCQDMLAWLPHNVTLHVLSFLDPVSLCRCSQINRTWNSLASNPVLWKNLCGHPDWQLSRVGEENERKKYTLQDGTIQWKKMFASRFLLHHNWLKGRCEVRTFEGHTQGISCVQFDDTRIVSGSSDKTIRVWDIQSEDSNAVLTLAGHSGTVRCLNLNGNRLVSGSVDRSIKVWDLSFKSYWSGASCKVTMIGHMHTVRCLQVDDKKVVSGSYDKTLKVWDIKTGHCQLTLRGHNAAVLCVQFDERKIVSGSYDKTIKVWCLVEGSCLMTLMGHHDAVTCLNLTFDSRKVISGSLDHNLKFWDLATGKCIGTLDWIRSEGHTGVIRCLQTDSWRIVSAGDDKTLKMWSLESGQRLLTLRCHTDGVTCLQFNDYSIVSGSYDKTVKFWDFTPSHEFLTPG